MWSLEIATFHTESFPSPAPLWEVGAGTPDSRHLRKDKRRLQSKGEESFLWFFTLVGPEWFIDHLLDVLLGCCSYNLSPLPLTSAF